MPKRKAISYKDAGVNIDESDRAVRRIRKLARSTFGRSVLTDIGTFGAGYRLSGWKAPVLVSSADGVGTKLKIAFMTDRHDTVGEDLVNHCVNDIAVQGARPLFFLDYFAVGKLDAKVAAQVVSGLARGCRNNGCALVGGETAEMPGLYFKGEYDLAGFIVGAVEQSRMITGASIRRGDTLLGLPSTGLHTNGYSLARHLLFEVARYSRRHVPPRARLDRGRRTAHGPPQLFARHPVAPRQGLAGGRRPHHRRGNHGQHSAHAALRPGCGDRHLRVENPSRFRAIEGHRADSRE